MGTAEQSEIIAKACKILERRFLRKGKPLHGTRAISEFLCMKFADLDREVFAVLFLDARHRLIKFEKMFLGTVNASGHIYPREIARAALKYNASAVIIAHNHPSGDPEPSRSDELATEHLFQILPLLDIKLLDHIVVAGARYVSFCERGWKLSQSVSRPAPAVHEQVSKKRDPRIQQRAKRRKGLIARRRTDDVG